MSYVPDHSYMGQYYFNPQWIHIAGEDSPSSLVYGNMVNFSVGPDGTHYFHQMFTGPFIAPTTQTVQSVKRDVAPPSYDEAVKRQKEKASGSSEKEPRHKREKEHFCDDDKTGQEEEEEKEEEEAEESSSCDEDDVWATEDEDNDDNEDNDNDSESSEEECNASQMRDHPRDRRRPLHNRRKNSPRSPRREVDARSTIVSLVPREFQGF